MGFIDDVTNKFSDALKGNTLKGNSETFEAQYPNSQELWSVDGESWHKVFAYQFKIVKKTNNIQEDYYFTLPIPPSTLQIKPVIPSKVTATIGGVVEENSPVSFWVISMSGTTGIAVSRAEGDENTRRQVAGKFRDTISTTGLLSGTFANVDRIVNKAVGVIDSAGNIVSRAQDALAAPGLSSFSALSGEVVGAVSNALLPSLPYSSSAVSGSTNGFTEAEELQKFFYIYQRLKSENPSDYTLYFINYKTQQQWRVIIKDFSLQKSAQNPMLYRYNIALQGWDILPANKADTVEFDRFGKDGDLKSVNTMGFGSKTTGLSLGNIKKALSF